MSFLNWLTGTAGYTAILAAFGLAVWLILMGLPL